MDENYPVKMDENYPDTIRIKIKDCLIFLVGFVLGCLVFRHG